MRQAWKKSRQSLAQIRTALQSGPDWPGVETMYVVGSLVGAFTGSIIGYRWHARRQHTDSLADDANSTEERPR